MAQEIRPVDSYQPGERIAMSFRVPAFLKQWLLDCSEASGRGLGLEIEVRLDRCRIAENDLAYFGTLDLAFGPSNAAVMLLIGLILSDGQTNVWEKGPLHPEAAVLMAAALAKIITILTGIETSVRRPASIAPETWEMRMNLMLRPLRQIQDFLVGRRSTAARSLDQLIVDRLTEDQKRRIAEEELASD
jgi:hypothetical protein